MGVSLPSFNRPNLMRDTAPWGERLTKSAANGYGRRWNAAASQDLLVVRPDLGKRVGASLVPHGTSLALAAMLLLLRSAELIARGIGTVAAAIYLSMGNAPGCSITLSTVWKCPIVEIAVRR